MNREKKHPIKLELVELTTNNLTTAHRVYFNRNITQLIERTKKQKKESKQLYVQRKTYKKKKIALIFFQMFKHIYIIYPNIRIVMLMEIQGSKQNINNQKKSYHNPKKILYRRCDMQMTQMVLT